MERKGPPTTCREGVPPTTRGPPCKTDPKKEESVQIAKCPQKMPHKGRDTGSGKAVPDKWTDPNACQRMQPQGGFHKEEPLLHVGVPKDGTLPQINGQHFCSSSPMESTISMGHLGQVQFPKEGGIKQHKEAQGHLPLGCLHLQGSSFWFWFTFGQVHPTHNMAQMRLP